MDKKKMLEYIEENKKIFTDVSDKVWDYAEIAFEEYKSVDALCEILSDFGFTIEKGIAKIPTAFKATFGSGKPTIGILAEYDALPSLSQKEGWIEKEEDKIDANGHGCGHNMLGAGALAAAVAIKKYLEENKKQGTVVLFGCPAEEDGSGKAFMAREGVFNSLDAALTWHPSSYNGVIGVSLLANYQVVYSFKGVSAHAAMAPHLGRSALDAVELMNVGANYLREHIIQDARLHYAVTDTGGKAPNVVQSHASVTYLVRAPKNSQVQEIYERLNMVAQGAAMMTQTEVTIELRKACSNIVNNRVLEKQLQKNFEEIGTPKYTEEETDFARRINDTFETKNISPLVAMAGKDFVAKLANQEIVQEIMPYIPIDKAAPGSSDVGDVSWNAPTAQIIATCYSKYTPEHTWQLVSQGKSSIAHKGLIEAGKVIAATAVDLIEDPELLSLAKQNFLEELGGETYKPAIPADVLPDIKTK